MASGTFNSKLIAYERTMAVQALVAKPAATLQKLEEIWESLGLEEQERYRRVQMLASSLALVCDHALMSAQSELEALELTKRDVQRRLAHAQRTLALPEELDGDLPTLQRRLDSLTALQSARRQRIAELEARLRAQSDEGKDAGAEEQGPRKLLQSGDRERALALIDEGKGAVYELLALVHTPTPQYQPSLLVSNVQRVRSVVQQLDALLEDDALTEQWTNAISALTAAVVALVRATHAATKDAAKLSELNEEAQAQLIALQALSATYEDAIRNAAASTTPRSPSSAPPTLTDAHEDLSEARLQALCARLGEPYVSHDTPRQTSSALYAEIAEIVTEDAEDGAVNAPASVSSGQSASQSSHSGHSSRGHKSSTSTKRAHKSSSKDVTSPRTSRTSSKTSVSSESSGAVLVATAQPLLVSTPVGTPTKVTDVAPLVLTVKKALPPPSASDAEQPPLQNIDAKPPEGTSAGDVASDDEALTAASTTASAPAAATPAATLTASTDAAPSPPKRSPQPPPKRTSSVRHVPKPLPKPAAASASAGAELMLGSRTARTLLVLVLGVQGVGRASLVQRLLERSTPLARDEVRVTVPLRAALVQPQRPWREVTFVVPPCEPTQSLASLAHAALREVEGVHALVLVTDARQPSSATAGAHWLKAAERAGLATLTVATHADEARGTALPMPSALRVSSVTGEGVDELWTQLLATVAAALAPRYTPLLEPQQGTFATEPHVDTPMTPQLVEFEDVYGQRFHAQGQVHWCFIGHHKAKDEYHVIAVNKEERDGAFAAVRITKKGQTAFSISAAALAALATSGKGGTGAGRPKYTAKLSQLLSANISLGSALDKLIHEGSGSAGSDAGHEGATGLAQLIEEYLTRESSSGAVTYYEMRNPRFAQELRELERAHPQRKSSFKIAWLYCTGSEANMSEVFGHASDAVPAGYWALLDALAEKISLKGWKKYRGDFGNVDDLAYDQLAYYAEWRGIEIMIHVAQWLNAEQHRRLIGNDVVVVIYSEADAPLNPAVFTGLGTVPHIFAVVKPHHQHSPGTAASPPLYRVDFFARPNIRAYKPHVAIDQVFTAPELREFLFTKCYNGYCEALAAPPMNRLYEVPRAAAINALVAKFPYESHEETRKRKRGETALRQLMEQARIRDPLLLLVTVGKSLPPVSASGKEFKASQIVLIVDDMEQRTRVVHKALHPEWNETLVFNVLAVDPAIATLRLQYRSKDRVIAHKEVPFSYICSVLKQEKWIELSVPGVLGASAQQPSSLTALASSMAALSLRFDLTGPGAVLCPTCKLYLGSSATVLFQDVQYHEHCIACAMCATSLKTVEFKVAQGKFYCLRCYSRHVDPSPVSPLSRPLLKERAGVLSMRTLTSVSSVSAASVGVPSANSTDAAQQGNEGDSDSDVEEPVRVGNLLEQLALTDAPHTWAEKHFGPLVDCGFCGEAIGGVMGKKEGFECSECLYPCHRHCKELVPGNCSHDPKTQVYHAASLNTSRGRSLRSTLKNISTKINK